MTELGGRERRLLDLSQVKDGRYKDAGIYVNEDNWARCTAVLAEWIGQANTERGGTSPFPYGIFLFQGEAAELQEPPEVLRSGPFLEMIPCDRPDRRAAKLAWNEAGTECGFSFAGLAILLGVEIPKGASLWIDAIATTDSEGKPVMALPVGSRIKRQPVKETAATRSDSK
ncbi:MAG: hypothetical protein ACOY93_18740 [Bacillota bacterium]